VDTLILEGELVLESQEGGYADPSWLLDGNRLSDLVIGRFDAKLVTWKGYHLGDKYIPGDIPIGRVRITIEKLERQAT